MARSIPEIWGERDLRKPCCIGEDEMLSEAPKMMDGQDLLLNRRRVRAFIAAALFAAIFLLANIPGQPVVDVDLVGDDFVCYIQSVVHGWPFCFLRHDGYYTGPFRYGPSPWRVGDHVRFTPAAFGGNAGILLGGILVTAKTVQWWLQTRRWQFRVVDMFVAIGVMCIIAAFITSRHRLHNTQVEWTDHDDAIDSVQIKDWQPFGPYWIRRITGPQPWSWGDRLVAADVIWPEDIAALPGKQGIRLLRISEVALDSVPSLVPFQRLVAIRCTEETTWWRENNIVDRDEADLSTLFMVVAQCESLEGLGLCGSPVKDEELVCLSGMARLRNLDLSNTSVSDAGLVHLARIKSLRKLVLRDTNVTEFGVARLRAQLPNCRIVWPEFNDPIMDGSNALNAPSQ